MDLQTPITPDLEGFRAKVLTIKPRTYVCCICHHNRINDTRDSGPRLCSEPSCHAQAAELGWSLS